MRRLVPLLACLACTTGSARQAPGNLQTGGQEALARLLLASGRRAAFKPSSPVGRAAAVKPVITNLHRAIQDAAREDRRHCFHDCGRWGVRMSDESEEDADVSKVEGKPRLDEQYRSIYEEPKAADEPVPVVAPVGGLDAQYSRVYKEPNATEVEPAPAATPAAVEDAKAGQPEASVAEESKAEEEEEDDFYKALKARQQRMKADREKRQAALASIRQATQAKVFTKDTKAEEAAEETSQEDSKAEEVAEKASQVDTKTDEVVEEVAQEDTNAEEGGQEDTEAEEVVEDAAEEKKAAEDLQSLVRSQQQKIGKDVASVKSAPESAEEMLAEEVPALVEEAPSAEVVESADAAEENLQKARDFWKKVAEKSKAEIDKKATSETATSEAATSETATSETATSETAVATEETRTAVYDPPREFPTLVINVGFNEDVMRQVVGREGYHFNRITEETGVKYIWHNPEEKKVEIWGPQENLASAAIALQKRLHMVIAKDLGMTKWR